MKKKEDVHLHVKLISKENKEPLKGDDYVVHFFDKDLVVDDYLGESSLDDFGHAQIIVHSKDYKVGGSFLERHPDIYLKFLRARMKHIRALSLRMPISRKQRTILLREDLTTI
ncbi:hypothetical protein [Ekhidna sp.]